MSPAAPASKAGKILVVDDNPIIQRTIYFVLRDRGYQVSICGELAEALSLVQKEKPNLILLDINFPLDAEIGTGVRDGFSALAWMQRMEELKGVPIVIISSDDPITASPRAQAAGAAGYLHKPISKDMLTLTVAELFAEYPPT
jgi:two-component system response regulator GlrR